MYTIKAVLCSCRRGVALTPRTRLAVSGQYTLNLLEHRLFPFCGIAVSHALTAVTELLHDARSYLFLLKYPISILHIFPFATLGPRPLSFSPSLEFDPCVCFRISFETFWHLLSTSASNKQAQKHLFSFIRVWIVNHDASSKSCLLRDRSYQLDLVVR
jgi:hypothetical protein